jgi:Mce-associated membrane protein
MQKRRLPMPVKTDTDTFAGSCLPEREAALDETLDADVGDDEGGCRGQSPAALPPEPASDTAESEIGEQVVVDQTPRRSWATVLSYVVLPGLALLLAAGAGYLKWQATTVTESQKAAASSVTAATEDTIALLSYHPDTVEKDLTSARDRVTGSFRDDYTKLTTDVVIPGSKEKKVSAVATVPAAASVSASENRAVVLVFVDQATTIGTDAPTDTASTVRLTLEKVDDRWLIFQFDPV